MQRLPQDDLREALTLLKTADGIDNQTAIRLKQKLAEDFRQQLMLGAPTIDDSDPNDQCTFLYSDPTVATINALTLPRYGLGVID